MKKYIAKTNVSINVVLPNGANRHIAFSALTGGGSVFYTEDADISQAMERHYRFGKLFRADPSFVSEKPQRKPASQPKSNLKLTLLSERPLDKTAEPQSIIPKGEEEIDVPAADTTTEGITVGEVIENKVNESSEGNESVDINVEDIETEDLEAEIESDIEEDETADDAQPEDNGLKTIVVSDPDSAKAYLAEHFSYSRTKIKTIKAIKEAAAAHGIVFEGI